MNNDDFQELVLNKLIKIENMLDKLITHRNPDLLGSRPKASWKPYYDLDEMDKYCNKNKKHPADLTGEEMAQFRISGKVAYINAQWDD